MSMKYRNIRNIKDKNKHQNFKRMKQRQEEKFNDVQKGINSIREELSHDNDLYGAKLSDKKDVKEGLRQTKLINLFKIEILTNIKTKEFLEYVMKYDEEWRDFEARINFLLDYENINLKEMEKLEETL